MALTANLLTSAGVVGINGPRIRYGSGAPSAATTANDGDTYVDRTANLLYGPRANGIWPTTSKSLVGPTGPVGTTSLLNVNLSAGQCVVAGQMAGFVAPISATTAAVTLPSPGTAYAAQYGTDGITTYFQGACFVVNAASTSSVTFTLVAVSTGNTYFTSAALAPGSVTTAGPFAAPSMAMPADNYVWKAALSSAGSIACQVYPFYIGPGEPGPSPSFYPRAGLTTGNVTATSGMALLVAGSDSYTHNYRNARASALYGAILSNQTAQAITFSFGGYTSPSVAANSVVTVGPLSPVVGANRLAAATTYQWTISGFSGSIPNALVSADAMVVI